MCSILGISFRQPTPASLPKSKMDIARDFLKELFRQAQRRGSAATGVMVVNRGGDKSVARMLRAPVPAKQFVESEEFDKLIRHIGPATTSIIGHTRAVTHGPAENNRNNHPHRAGGIVGVHNGSIKDQLIYKRFPGIIPNSDCDSEALFQLINLIRSQGHDTLTSVQKASAHFAGWFAAAFVDLKHPSELFLFRDSTTPLSVLWDKETGATVFASLQTYIKEANTKHQFLSDKSEEWRVSDDHVVKLKSLYWNPTRFIYEKRQLFVAEEEKKKYLKENKHLQTITAGEG